MIIKNPLDWLKRRTSMLAAINIGAALEWYEIGVFIGWQLIIQNEGGFFNLSMDDSVNATLILTIALLSVFSGGARALGGWFFGKRGDKEGRKAAFPLTILVATLPSWGLFCLSYILSYEQWVNYASLIFAVVKFFQGMPAGGELPGAICYLSELEEKEGKDWRSQRYLCSYALLGPQIGLAVSFLLCLILKLTLPLDILVSQIWRFVFLASGIIGLFGFVIRRKLHETHPFLKKKSHHTITHSPLKTAFRYYLDKIVFAGMISVFEIVSFGIVSIVPFYYSLHPFNLATEFVVMINIAFCLVCIFSLPILGFLSATHIKIPWMKISGIGVILLTPFLYIFLIEGSLILSIAVNVLLIFLFSIQAAILPSILAKLFPVEIRYTAIAFSFNIFDGILWTLVTSISFCFIEKSSPFFVLFLIPAALFFMAILLFRKKVGIPSYLVK